MNLSSPTCVHCPPLPFLSTYMPFHLHSRHPRPQHAQPPVLLLRYETALLNLPQKSCGSHSLHEALTDVLPHPSSLPTVTSKGTPANLRKLALQIFLLSAPKLVSLTNPTIYRTNPEASRSRNGSQVSHLFFVFVVIVNLRLRIVRLLGFRFLVVVVLFPQTNKR